MVRGIRRNGCAGGCGGRTFLLASRGHAGDGAVPLTTGIGASPSATVFLLAWMYNRPTLSWIASFLMLGAVAYECSQRFRLPMPSWPTFALLTHATLALGAAPILRLKSADLEAKRTRLFERPRSLRLGHPDFVAERDRASGLGDTDRLLALLTHSSPGWIKHARVRISPRMSVDVRVVRDALLLLILPPVGCLPGMCDLPAMSLSMHRCTAVHIHTQLFTYVDPYV